jgi:Mn2+/Fe2+ NRAMP family transporter
MEQHNDIDTKTRSNLAYIWSSVAALILGYIVYKWGDQKEILTLIIGLIGGTVLGGIFGIYFGGSINKHADSGNGVTVIGDNPTVPVNNTTPADVQPNQTS